MKFSIRRVLCQINHVGPCKQLRSYHMTRARTRERERKIEGKAKSVVFTRRIQASENGVVLPFILLLLLFFFLHSSIRAVEKHTTIEFLHSHPSIRWEENKAKTQRRTEREKHCWVDSHELVRSTIATTISRWTWLEKNSGLESTTAVH